MEFLIVFKFFVSVSDEVFNILRNSPLDLLVGQCPTISIIGGARAPAAPAESTPMSDVMSHVLEEETAKRFQPYFMQILLSQNHNLIPK